MTNVTALKTNQTKPAPRVPSVEEATHDLEQLGARIVENARAIAECEAQMGADYKSVAAGGAVAGSDELGRLLGEQHALAAMKSRAEEMLEAAKKRAFTLSVLAARGEARAKLDEYDRLAEIVAARIDDLAEALQALREHGRNFVRELRHKRHFKNGTLTSDGWSMLPVDAMLGDDNVKFLAESQLASALGWWRTEHGHVPGDNHFGRRIRAQTEQWVQGIDDALDVANLDGQELKAIAAERVA